MEPGRDLLLYRQVNAHYLPVVLIGSNEDHLPSTVVLAAFPPEGQGHGDMSLFCPPIGITSITFG